MPNLFSNFFTTVGKKLSEKNLIQTVENLQPAPNKNIMHVMEASYVELEEVIKGLKLPAWDGWCKSMCT